MCLVLCFHWIDSRSRAWVSAWAQRPLKGFAHRVLGDWEISEIVSTPLYTVAYVGFSGRTSLGVYQCLWYQIRTVTTGFESFMEGYENLKWNFKTQNARACPISEILREEVWDSLSWYWDYDLDKSRGWVPFPFCLSGTHLLASKKILPFNAFEVITCENLKVIVSFCTDTKYSFGIKMILWTYLENICSSGGFSRI